MSGNANFIMFDGVHHAPTREGESRTPNFMCKFLTEEMVTTMYEFTMDVRLLVRWA
jgi:hypothetical protein